MRIIRTHEMTPEDLSEWDRDMVYNGLDCCVTLDVYDGLRPQLDNITASTYAFSKSLQAPTLEMRARGVLVDQVRKAKVIDEYYEIMERLEANLLRIVHDGVGMSTFNYRSTRDLQTLFYDELGIHPIRKAGRPTVDRGAREKLEIYPIAEQLVKHINLLTELGDKISVLKTAIDDDGRIRTSYNIAGTSTGRFSSSISEFGTGGNLQNVEESLRSIFIADDLTLKLKSTHWLEVVKSSKIITGFCLLAIYTPSVSLVIPRTKLWPAVSTGVEYPSL
jgi:DNA polymerase I-like protein with 3'-5' exonuclease and polymerase domains